MTDPAEREAYSKWILSFPGTHLPRGLTAIDGWQARAAISSKREAELLARVAELEQDAARYRWLRDTPATNLPPRSASRVAVFPP